MTTRTQLINRRYRLERRVLITETSETWLGFDNVLYRAVAVTTPRQELMRNPSFLAEFVQRSQIATALHHRGIVAAFDSGEEAGTPFLIAEYTGGEQLSDVIRLEAPFDVDDVAILVEQVAGALDYAHQRGFVHGSLKAADIVVDGQGATKLLGLGIPTESVPWRSNGTADFPVTFDDDVRSLAAIAYAMLTGEDPIVTEAGVVDEAYLIDPDVPRNASDVVAVGLGASQARFSSAGAFARALRDWRTFEYQEFVPLSPPVAASFEKGTLGYTSFESRAGDLIEAEEETPRIPAPSEARPLRDVTVALVAALLLAVLAGVLVWQGDKTTAGSLNTLPEQIESLAQLTGF